MRMMSIASGSSGNCIYIGSDNTHILIDAGVSRKKIAEGLKKADLSMADISAIFVTHEHIDHTKGIGVISRKDNTSVYSTQGTIDGIFGTSSLGEMDRSLFHSIRPEEDILLNDLRIHPFSVSHDANDPVAYTVECGNRKMGIVTDLGFYDSYIVDQMQGCQAMLVEANHDINLLQVGSYPYHLKQRILGNKGHLSNETSGKMISQLLNDNVQDIFLGHLSKENNYDKLAFETVRLEIDMGENDYKANDFRIEVAHRSEPSRIINL